MIKEEFIGLKYKGVKSVYDLKESDDLKTRIGWKCRKYQNWKEVHHTQSDKDSLRKFGDALVDQSEILLDMLGDVNLVLLKVQRWRLDKENFDVDPPNRKEYDELKVLIGNVREEKQFIISYLVEKGYSPNELKVDIQLLFYILLLKNYLESVTTVSFPKTLIDTIINEEIFSSFDQLYQDHSLKLNLDNEARYVIQCIYEDLGFNIHYYDELNIESDIRLEKRKTVVEYKKMSVSELVNISTIGHSTLIKLNENNLYIKKILSSNNESERMRFEKFIKAIAESYLDLNDHQDVLDTFLSYLSLKLNDEMRRK
ncbi:hypothetical protein AB2B38_008370 [Balneola sp. MJW-20]|uniref:hypothetical protein n=1 Tax=Gracilimonas aurantiaca TaxID=3234185 RepID=UPI0034666A4E